MEDFRIAFENFGTNQETRTYIQKANCILATELKRIHNYSNNNKCTAHFSSYVEQEKYKFVKQANIGEL